jgi:hypothetical protein
MNLQQTIRHEIGPLQRYFSILPAAMRVQRTSSAPLPTSALAAW